MDISVYVTSYNQKEYLKEAIESVLAQTLRPLEIIVVDDFSQDGSRSLIAGYQSRYPELIVPVFNEQNMGVAQTRNAALGIVRGDYVTYLDGDDRYLPEKLEKESARIQAETTAQLVFSNFYYIDSAGQRTGVWAARSSPPEGNIFHQTFAREFPRGSLFRNELVNFSAWRRIGFYDQALPIYEDYEMRIRLTNRLRAVYCDQPLSEYRRHERSLRSTPAADKLRWFDYICQKNRPLIENRSDPEASYVVRRIREWRAHLLRMQAKEALGIYSNQKPNRRRALSHYLDALRYHLYLDPDLVLGLLLPSSLYQAIRGKIKEGRRLSRQKEVT